MSSLILLRHGQAAFGQTDYDQLSPLGIAQARATGTFLREREPEFTDIFSGPRQRHLDTTRNLVETLAPQHVWQTENALDELAEAQEILAAAQTHFGVVLYAPHMARHTQLRYYNDMMRAWGEGRAPMGAKPTAQAFRQTVARWLRNVVHDSPPGRRILAVTSAGVIGAILCEVLGTNTSTLMTYAGVLRNASLTEIVFSRGRTSMLSFNSTHHLPAELTSAI